MSSDSSSPSIVASPEVGWMRPVSLPWGGGGEGGGEPQKARWAGGSETEQQP